MHSFRAAKLSEFAGAVVAGEIEAARSLYEQIKATYAWRHGNSSVELDIWCHANAINRNERDIETVEAEVACLICDAAQWPAAQTEIHFHLSSRRHRAVASEIMRHYQLWSPIGLFIP